MFRTTLNYRNLGGKVSNFTSGNYKAVTGLAYDATNKQLGLKVGADSVIPFKSQEHFKLILVGQNSFRLWGTSDYNWEYETINVTHAISINPKLAVGYALNTECGGSSGGCYFSCSPTISTDSTSFRLGHSGPGRTEGKVYVYAVVPE